MESSGVTSLTRVPLVDSLAVRTADLNVQLHKLTYWLLIMQLMYFSFFTVICFNCHHQLIYNCCSCFPLFVQSTKSQLVTHCVWYYSKLKWKLNAAFSAERIRGSVSQLLHERQNFTWSEPRVSSAVWTAVWWMKMCTDPAADGTNLNKRDTFLMPIFCSFLSFFHMYQNKF